MMWTYSPKEVAAILQEKYGYFVVGVDEEFKVGEQIGSLESRGAVEEATGTIIGISDYKEYRKQALNFRAFQDTCTDCWTHYYRVRS